MKKRMRGAKGLLILFLVAVLVVAGVLASHPGKSQAAAKGTLYNVEILDTATPFDVSKPTVNNESPFVTRQVLPGKGLASEILDPIVIPQEGITFQMLVGTKVLTETLKVGTTKTKVSYYPVTILYKTYKDPGGHYAIAYGEETLDGMIKTKLLKDAIGKLYFNGGGDVDVKNVQAEKKQTQIIGDGTTDPAGSLIIPIMLFYRQYDVVDKGVTIAKEAKWTSTLTTGQNSTLIKGSKSAFEGKVLPDDDTSGMLPKPLVGQPIDLKAGTGTLVATECSMNLGVMMLGKTDYPRSFIWKMKITPAS